MTTASGAGAPRVSVLRAGAASATIDVAEGGNLLSVVIGGVELLQPRRAHQGPIPRYGSFLLAPWVGELYEGRLAFRGAEHQLPVNVGRHAAHGLVFQGRWDVEREAADVLALRRQLDPPWPFGGTVRQRFELDTRGLTQFAEITAADRAMPVGLGWHPWFQTPEPDLVRVRVDADRFVELDAESIPTGTISAVSGEVDLRVDGVFGTRRIDVVLIDARSPARLSVGGRALDIEFDPTISTVVVYSADGTICIEPWSTWPDAVRSDARGLPAGTVVLEPYAALRHWMRWTWSW